MRAYRSVNGKKKLIAKSMTYHIDGEVHKSCVNAKALKIMKTKLALKKRFFKENYSKSNKAEQQEKTALEEACCSVPRLFDRQKYSGHVKKMV